MGKKLIVVVGATGAQGGGVVDAILADKSGEWAVRAVTRDANSDKSKALAARGAEVVSGDVNDPESIKKALQGAYGAFFVTFFWEHFSVDTEKKQAKIMADAAKEAKLEHVIWSTLDDTRVLCPLSDNRMPTLQEKYKVPHFDGKAEADQYFKDAGVPTTFLLTSFYWDNIIGFGMGPQKGPDGSLSIGFPIGDQPMSGISAGDIGQCAFGVFKRGKELVGKYVGVAGDHVTGDQMAASLSKALGVSIKYNAIDPAVYRKFPFPHADDLGNMFQYYRDFSKEFMAARDVKFARSLYPELKSWDDWVKANASKIPLPK